MSLIPAAASRGKMRFMIIGKGSVNASVFIEFLRRLVAGAKRPIFLIVDRGSAHRAKKVSAFAPTLGGKLRLFFLPPYSPDRNPGELVWKHLKSDTAGRMAVSGRGRFREEGSPLAAQSAKRRSQNHLLLAKALAQIRRVKMNLLTDGLI